MSELNTIALSHDFLSRYAKEGAVCIDATAGRGYDTEFLCSKVGEKGKVYAFDIQKEAIESTEKRLSEKGYKNAEVILASHSDMDKYVKEKVDCIVFNLGWLPKGDHNIHTEAKSSIEAIEKGLSLLKNGGGMNIAIYYGRETGYEERDALLEYLPTLDSRKYTVVEMPFVNRPNCPPIPIIIFKN
ncbi:MAG: methyltransferase domain-containing protein [Oscillospiraceae bacterium]|nr:methyltransferase domain-containing protein [Oscillospiraceae bacterium]